MDNQNANPQQALIDRLQESTNILVTVSANPSVDQLAACLGLTLWLNKIGKHGTAVFSGEVPSTLEFLQPAATLEKNTDSLRDFIIALDKTKADKLRYKVEDSVVRIFITPYRTSLSADDFQYSQGDFNVDMVIALGVAAQEDLDTAITAHGRILHDAAVATIMVNGTSELGSINWQDAQASSLSELVVDLGNGFGREHLDGQIATALLTGIVAETARFSNDKTSPQTMNISAELMSAGANQQLVANQLDAPEPEVAPTDDAPSDDAAQDQPAGEPNEDAASPDGPKSQDGTIEIDHEHDPEAATEDNDSSQPDGTNEASAGDDQPVVEAQDSQLADETTEPSQNEPRPSSKMIVEPPLLGGTLTANSRPDDMVLEPSSDPFSQAGATDQPILDRESGTTLEPTNQSDETPVDQPDAITDSSQSDDQPAALQPAPPSWMPPQPWIDQPGDSTTDQPAMGVPGNDLPLPEPVADQLPAASTDQSQPVADSQDNETPAATEEVDTNSHSQAQTAQPADVDSARDEVMRAINSAPDSNLAPVQALNAQPIELDQPSAQPDLPLPSEVPPLPPAASTAFDPASFDTLDKFDTPPAPSSALDSLQPAVPTLQPTPDPELTGPVEQPFTMPLPQALTPAPSNPMPPTSTVTDPTAPPPVPPPLMPPAFPPAS